MSLLILEWLYCIALVSLCLAFCAALFADLWVFWVVNHYESRRKPPPIDRQKP